MLLAGRRRLAGLLEQGRSSSNRAKIRAGNPSAKKIIITRYGVFCITLIAAEYHFGSVRAYANSIQSRLSCIQEQVISSV